MTSALYTAGIMLGITFLFIFLFSLLHLASKKKAATNQKERFERLTSTYNLIINEKEQFQHYLIAIDTLNAKLLYLNFSSKEDGKVIDLAKIKTTKLDIEEKSVYENKKGKRVFVEKHLLKLQLELTPKDANQPKELLPLYQYQDGMVDFDKVKTRSEYWRNNINNLV